MFILLQPVPAILYCLDAITRGTSDEVRVREKVRLAFFFKILSSPPYAGR